MRCLGLAGVCLWSLAVSGCSAPAASPDEPVAAAASAIAYGTADTAHAAVVSVLGALPGGYAECSGTVVQVKGGVGYVLTAAHCCNAGSPDVVVVSDDYHAAAAALTLRRPPEAPAYVVTAGSVYYDALYDPNAAGRDHDFCMFKFEAPPGTSVIPVARPEQDGLSLGVEVEHVGFGLVDTDAPATTTANTSRRTGTAPVDLQLTANLLLSRQGGPSHVPGTCEGDSGGPALAPAGAAPSEQRVVGTTSYGNDGTCAGITVGVCSRVSSETGPGGFITSFLDDAPSGVAAPLSCDQCERAAPSGACSGQVDACFDDPSCETLNTCLGACTTVGCVTTCDETAGATAAGELHVATTCILAACIQCTPSSNVCHAISSGVPACDTCLDRSCCSEGAACVDDPACAACLVASPAASCATDARLTALSACLGSSCAALCGPSSSGSGGGGSGGGSVEPGGSCSVGGTPEPGPLAPLAGLLLAAAGLTSRRGSGGWSRPAPPAGRRRRG